jgi:hypothetical protein
MSLDRHHFSPSFNIIFSCVVKVLQMLKVELHVLCESRLASWATFSVVKMGVEALCSKIHLV